ncbi:MAG: hypothetical protein ACRD07_02760 [Acidimicrobiales bacterium]
MNLTHGTRTLLVALTVAGSALVAPAMALAETPSPEDPIGPVDVANPTENPEPEPCDDPGDCLANPTENPEPCDDPGDCLANPTENPDPGGEGGEPGDDDSEPQADVDEPVLANPTFTG